MATDPNKVYLENGSEARKMSRAERDANYKVSRERFQAQRKKYKDTPVPAQTPLEAAAAIKRGTQPGHAVTSVDRKTGKPN